MTDLKEAFERVGLPTGAVAFAAACHDLARLALNREESPKRAAAVWLALAHGRDFKEAITEFLAAVAEERAGKVRSVDGEGHRSFGDAQSSAVPSPTEPNASGVDQLRFGSAQKRDIPPLATDEQNSVGGEDQGEVGNAQLGGVPLSAETLSGSDEGQSTDVPHNVDVPSLPDLVSDGEDHSFSVKIDHDTVFPPSEAPHTPSPSTLRAMIAARQQSARVMSGFYVTERQGSRTAIEDIAVNRLERLCSTIGRYAATRAVEYNALRLLTMRMPAYAPTGATVADVYSPQEVREVVSMARAITAGPLMTVPEVLRASITGVA